MKVFIKVKETLLGKSDGGESFGLFDLWHDFQDCFLGQLFFATFALLNGEDTETEVTSAGANCAFM